ncbi:hypothetical protein FRB99_002496, partial [Tulasnella sp. 403]
MFASKRKVSPALLVLALLTHLSLTGMLLLPSVILVLVHSSGPASSLKVEETDANAKRGSTSDDETPEPYRKPRDLVSLVAEYAAYTAVLAGISTFVCGDWSWVERTWGASLLLPDLTPNPGLWWYFFTEMFDHFRSFFLVVFSMHLVIYVAPLCIKFSHDPLYATFILQGVIATFKPYPTLADPGLFVSMFTIFPEVFP